jgi:Asp-tRNA(Asn)/Glu-tRNA(Gln) amidotransferase A subunit family amidase
MKQPRRKVENLAGLSALESRDLLASGAVQASELTEALLDRIAAREDDIGAFAYLNPEQTRLAARRADDHRATGKPVGPLHGLSVGVKDIIDTADMPTENGTPIDKGRRPESDATLVKMLRSAGAIVIGKTVTTEFASRHPGKTRNPHDLAHSPGGSSSGSAAAVAAGVVPLAIGTQTSGSVIRPASFCGVVGYKPTHGWIPRTGMHIHDRTLDTVGVFARTVGDAALLADSLIGHDPHDSDTRAMPPPCLLEALLREPQTTPALAFVKTPVWGAAEPDTKKRFVELAASLGDRCTEVKLPKIFDQADLAQRTLMGAGVAYNIGPYYERARDELSDYMCQAVERGRTIPATDYLDALEQRRVLNDALEKLFDRYDAILTPAAPGEAPRDLNTTGEPIFNALWTLCGVPAVTLPLLRGPNGLPLGVQLVGRRGDDARLLRTAQWLSNIVIWQDA